MKIKKNGIWEDIGGAGAVEYNGGIAGGNIFSVLLSGMEIDIKGTGTQYMFAGEELTALPKMDTSGVIDMGYMFRGAKLRNVDFTGIDTSKASGFPYIFDGADISYDNYITGYMDLRSFDFSRVTASYKINNFLNGAVISGYKVYLPSLAKFRELGVTNAFAGMKNHSGGRDSTLYVQNNEDKEWLEGALGGATGFVVEIV